jgi:hypothetical protein
MAVIISNVPGSVAVLPGAATPLTVSIDGFRPTTTRAIITKFAVTQRGAAQFLQTLEDFIYVYVFGDTFGAATIDGIFFSGSCDGGMYTGSDDIFDFYNVKKIASTGKPVTLQIGLNGVGRFNAFLMACSVQANDPSTQRGSFSLTFNVIPARRPGGEQ